ncbi:ROK family protein [Wukongibacter baidiensis]|uniref:ROK family protein n=1 Tax=Wukongibacter baidiensis TaxID=1723361 RepID=UPI003D7FFEED
MNYLCVDIGGTNIKYGVLNHNGDIVMKNVSETPKENYNSLVESIIAIYEDTEKKGYRNIKGIALAVPAVIDNITGMIVSPGSLEFIEGKNIKKSLEDRLNIPVEAENDGNCAALAEVWRGAAKENNDVALVVLGTGIGGAVIKNREIHRGANLHSGEFGYAIHQFNYESKNFNIWSHTASTDALVKNVARRMGVKEDELNGFEVFTLASKGNEIAIEEIDKFYYTCAVGIYNIQYYYDPEVILIGGAISSRETLISEINKRLDIILKKINIAKIYPKIKTCNFLNDANLIGALYNFLKRNN